MFSLNDEEKKAVLFLAAVLIAGCAIQYCRQQFPALEQAVCVQDNLGKVNLNTADERLLMVLPGVGKTLANRIVAYRRDRGAFSSVEELSNIKGFKGGRFQKIRNQVYVE
jgi:competence ComEA-like helix-hairpin-helix protein